MAKRRTWRTGLPAVSLMLLPVRLPVLLLMLMLPIMLATGGCEGKPDDVQLIQVTHLAEIRMPGQTIPARNDTMLLWLGEGKARSETATSSFILREDLGLLGSTSRWLVVPDPPGARVGSGGSTLGVLDALVGDATTCAEALAGRRVPLPWSAPRRSWSDPQLRRRRR